MHYRRIGVLPCLLQQTPWPARVLGGAIESVISGTGVRGYRGVLL